MVKKSRFFGILSGIISLFLAFLSKLTIPLTADLEINFNLFSLNDVEFYYWGYLLNENTASTSILNPFPENLIAIFIWISINVFIFLI